MISARRIWTPRKSASPDLFDTMSDYLGGLEAWYLSQAFEKTVLTPEQSAEAVGGVTKEQVVKAAQTVSLGVRYISLRERRRPK